MNFVFVCFVHWPPVYPHFPAVCVGGVLVLMACNQHVASQHDPCIKMAWVGRGCWPCGQSVWGLLQSRMNEGWVRGGVWGWGWGVLAPGGVGCPLAGSFVLVAGLFVFRSAVTGCENHSLRVSLHDELFVTPVTEDLLLMLCSLSFR